MIQDLNTISEKYSRVHSKRVGTLLQVLLLLFNPEVYFTPSLLIQTTSYFNIQAWSLIKLGSKDAERSIQQLRVIAGMFTTHAVAHHLLQTIHALWRSMAARAQPLASATTLTALVNLAMFPLIHGSRSHDLGLLTAIHLLTAPLLIHHLRTLSPPTLFLINKQDLPWKVLQAVILSKVHSSFSADTTLCLVGNLVQLIPICDVKDERIGVYVKGITVLVGHCEGLARKGKATCVVDHPVFGWCTATSHPQIVDALPLVASQLHGLWDRRVS